MKRTLLTLSLLGATVFVPYAAFPADQQMDDAVMSAIYEAALKASPVTGWAVVQKFEGSMDEVEGFQAAFQKAFTEQGLDRGLEGFDASSIAILYGDPDAPGGAKMLVGLTTPARFPAREPLMAHRIELPRAVRYTHQGAYEDLREVHGAVSEAVASESRFAYGAPLSTSFPVVLRFVNDPRFVRSAADIKTEMIVSVDAGSVPPLSKREVAGIAAAVGHPSAVSYSMVSQSFEGSMEQVEKFLAAFMEEFDGQGLGKYVDIDDSAPLLVLYGDPDKSMAVKMDIGLPVRGNVKAKKPLKSSSMKFERAVRYEHDGAYDQLSEVHRAVESKVRAMAKAPSGKAGTHWPVVLRLLTNPQWAESAEDIKTEMIVPIGHGR